MVQLYPSNFTEYIRFTTAFYKYYSINTTIATYLKLIFLHQLIQSRWLLRTHSRTQYWNSTSDPMTFHITKSHWLGIFSISEWMWHIYHDWHNLLINFTQPLGPYDENNKTWLFIFAYKFSLLTEFISFYFTERQTCHHSNRVATNTLRKL